MSKPRLSVGSQVVIQRADLQHLLDALIKDGYHIVGPTLRDSAIVYDELEALTDLPIGWTDEQDGGTYRLKERDDEALFGYQVGPHSWKKYLHPPRRRLWQAEMRDNHMVIVDDEPDYPRYAFFGVRSCELNAITIQDTVFTSGPYVDIGYRERRKQAFIVVVNCVEAGGTCFCASMNTGPQAEQGFDLALTELLDPNQHYFVVDIGSKAGAAIIKQVPHQQAQEQEHMAAQQAVAQAARQMGRTLDTRDIKMLLYNKYEHPRWDEVARRCLSCTNCTLVCPTCFCVSIEEQTDLNGQTAERWQRWDSCFTADFSYIHGGSVRSSASSRYRQWLTHKLASWIDQFGTSGCVGCGRCITWCPVGIDLTEEVRALRDGEPRIGVAIPTLDAV